MINSKSSYSYYIEISEIIQLSEKKKIVGSYKNIIYKMWEESTYLIVGYHPPLSMN